MIHVSSLKKVLYALSVSQYHDLENKSRLSR